MNQLQSIDKAKPSSNMGLLRNVNTLKLGTNNPVPKKLEVYHYGISLRSSTSSDTTESPKPNMNLEWKWHDRLVPLCKMKDGQLHSIIESIEKFPRIKEWHGTPKEVWETSIKKIIKSKYRYQTPANLIENLDRGQRIRAGRNADVIIKQLINCKILSK